MNPMQESLMSVRLQTESMKCLDMAHSHQIFQKIKYYVGESQLVDYEELTKGNPNMVMLLESEQQPGPSTRKPYVFSEGKFELKNVDNRNCVLFNPIVDTSIQA